MKNKLTMEELTNYCKNYGYNKKAQGTSRKIRRSMIEHGTCS